MGDFNHIILYSFDPPQNDPTILFARILRGERGIPYDIILGGWEKMADDDENVHFLIWGVD